MNGSTNNAPTQPPGVLRRLDSPGAARLAELTETFEELQTVLRCCERLVSELASAREEHDDVVIEAVWTVAVMSYARCFNRGDAGTALVEDDLTAALSSHDVLDWHHVLLRLRDHYADPSTNPRERFSVGVSQDDSGAPSGIAITSARQPLVDDLTVRQTGAIAFALSSRVNDLITTQQEKLFAELKNTPRQLLDELPRLDVAPTGTPG